MEISESTTRPLSYKSGSDSLSCLFGLRMYFLFQLPYCPSQLNFIVLPSHFQCLPVTVKDLSVTSLHAFLYSTSKAVTGHRLTCCFAELLSEASKCIIHSQFRTPRLCNCHCLSISEKQLGDGWVTTVSSQNGIFTLFPAICQIINRSDC